MEPYSMGLRECVLADCEAGMKTKAVATKHRVSPAWVRRLKQRKRETGQVGPSPHGGGRVPKIDRERLARQVEQTPDATLAELRDKLGVRCALSALHKALATLRITLKQKSMRAAEQDRPDVARKWAEWKLWQIGIDPGLLVFIDETWAKTNMTRLRGGAEAGRRVVGTVPHGHWKTTTLVAALSLSGVRCSMVNDGAINRRSFEAFVEQVLAPTLKPGLIVVMDNLSSHKGPRVAELIRKAGAELLYLPPYSPDLSPVEPAFSKIKQLLRSATHRTSEALWGAMQSILDCVTASDAQGYFGHCGYATL